MRKSILLITLFALMALVAFLYAFQFPHSDPLPVKRFAFHRSDPNSNVDFRWKLGNPYLLKGGDGNVFLDLQVSGKALATAQRKPMNLVLVIDRSGSMGSENKLEQVKEAAAAIIDNMLETDRLAVVIYDDAIQTMIPSTPVKEKQQLKSSIYALSPGGSTNLYGGLERGFQEAHENFQRDYVNRIILLSDGLANVGVTDPDQITARAKNIRSNSISVSAMGVGVDYNESLMANIADYAGGNYYYISRDMNIAEVFRKEWNLMQKLVATEARATFELAKGVDVADVAGFKWRKEGRTVTIEVPDIYSGETKRILVQLHAPANSTQPVVLGQGMFTCTEITGEKTHQFAQAFEPSIKVVNDVAMVRDNLDRAVHAKVAAVQASEKMEQAYKHWEAGEVAPARELNAKAIEELKALGYVENETQVKRYEKFQQQLAAPAAAMPSPVKQDILKKQKEADRNAQQSNSQ